ncbi:TIGR03857 family LLM class F420-dependent oxidoreductase [Mycobacterium sp. E3247]|uniref:TIGR03857 family LLM class F420-dependent oxidoreductase n=1 Tax=Mycobacterium sp. E3247 TaxID=1856864 RepID=UPI0008020CDF|nr:TIGR03857 family LLM class F420-dependent oxidoreductase [Mycobacterium sp. E3247]OBH01483.1 LLM class F420-dependent oxidoreductase [Mycobacterium sp. E3247]
MGTLEPHGSPHDRFGAYLLPGRVLDPRVAIGQARAAEQTGLSTAWISERLGNKDIGPLAAAVAQATTTIKVASGVTNIGLRHPLQVASTAMTLQGLASGRFVLGLGRLNPAAAKAYGLPPVTNAVVTDTADLLRRLCRGEKVSYSGPAGTFPKLRLTDLPNVAPPPLVFGAIGPKSLELAGTHFDGVLLHPMLTVDAVARSAAAVRDAADRSGRDPSEVRVYASVLVAPELPEREEIATIAARAVTYFQIAGYGESLTAANHWDPSPLTQLRAHPFFGGSTAIADYRFTRYDLADVAKQCIPSAWIESAAVVGSARHCAERLVEYLAAGADELVLHGATPELLGPLMAHAAECTGSSGPAI